MPLARPTRMGIKKHRGGGAGGSFLQRGLEVFFHSELVLTNEKLFEGVEAVLLVEDEHGFRLIKTQFCFQLDII